MVAIAMESARPPVSTFIHLIIDGCPEENFQIEKNGISLPALWPESNIGPITIPCPCGKIPTGREILRQCRGDYINQAAWEARNDTACKDLDFLLCQISEVRSYVITL